MEFLQQPISLFYDSIFLDTGREGPGEWMIKAVGLLVVATAPSHLF